LSDLEKERRIS